MRGVIPTSKLVVWLLQTMYSIEPRHKKTYLRHMQTTKAQISLCFAVTLWKLLQGPARRRAEPTHDHVHILPASRSAIDCLSTWRILRTSLNPSHLIERSSSVIGGLSGDHHFRFHGQHSHQIVLSQTVVKPTLPHSTQLCSKGVDLVGAPYVVLTVGYLGSFYPGYPVITFYSDLKWDSGA